MLRRLARFWPLLLIAGLALWWSQPHLGWNYCVSGGFTRNADFMNVLNRQHSGTSADVINAGRERSSRVSKACVDMVERQAFNLMAQCLAERDVRYCRYAGRESSAIVHDDQELFTVAKGEEWQYRYISPDSDVGMSIIPLEAGLASNMTIFDYTQYWSQIRTVCRLGCDCNPRIDG